MFLYLFPFFLIKEVQTMTIYTNIKYLADRKGITIKQLEKECNLSNGTIRRWDNQSPSVDRIYMIAQYFNVSIEDIITGNFDSINEKPKTEEKPPLEYVLVDSTNDKELNEKTIRRAIKLYKFIQKLDAVDLDWDDEERK